jgi:phosphoribosylamine--glycine ligase
MKVLVIGSGGREHAVCLSFIKSKNIEKVYCAPGNAGISKIAETADIGVNDFENLAKFVRDNNIDFTFVGPEIPLSQGITDYFEEKGLKIVGPSKQASMLESSKIFSKEFMNKYGVPTAQFNKFSDAAAALAFLSLCEKDKKIVVKADGLAAGKGVYVCSGREEAENAVEQIMNDKVLGNAGTNIIIEEYIDGPELSYLIFTDGISYRMMPASQDHKRINDNDEGPNTGGMGAYSPAPLATPQLNKKVE